MKGLQLSRQYYEHIGYPMLASRFPELLPQMAIGLVGEGSECLGFDDDFSQDHDFGVGFCIWLPESTFNIYGKEVQAAYDALPAQFAGFYGRNVTVGAGQRVGVFSIEHFYRRYLNCVCPQTAMDWLKIPMSYLATATNGEVFYDGNGEFSRIRMALQQYYPEDVRRKKLAAKVFTMAQAGQYNYSRSLKRNDGGASYLALAEFVKATMAVLYLLNKAYMPFYKWVFRGSQELSQGQDTITKVRHLMTQADAYEKIQLIEAIAADAARYLIDAGLSTSHDTFLEGHAQSIMQGIKSAAVRQLPLAFDVE